MTKDFELEQYFSELNEEVKSLGRNNNLDKSNKFESALSELLDLNLFEEPTDRNIETEERILFDIDKQDIQEISDEMLTTVIEEETQYEDLNSESKLPNIPVEEINEYLLVRGIYCKHFKEFIMNDKLIPIGDYPLAIEYEGEVIVYKMIHPEPKVLHMLQQVLVGFEFKHFKDNIFKEMDIYHFLGKVKLLGGI